MSSANIVPVGFDLGSVNCRVGIDARGVVSNTQGSRSTHAIVAKEGDEDAYVFGDAAARLAFERVAEVVGEPSCAEFCKYMLQLCVDNAACSADEVKVVVSVPSSAKEEDCDKLKEMFEKTIRSMISNKSKRKQQFCVGLLTEAAAVCVAHNIKGNQTVLVVDGGASGLKLTTMSVKNGIYSQLSQATLDTISGPILLKLLAQHVATQFERSSRIPRGEVWESKKARTKLLKEAERVLVGSSSGTLSFTIDGLFEGMDCHVNVSKPRWDMMTGSLVRQVEAKLNETAATIDTVLCAGAWVGLLDATLKKTFPQATFGTGVIPEEAVVLGCAKQASFNSGLELVCKAPTVEVPVSPVCISLDSEKLILQGTPLPCRMTCQVSQPSKLLLEGGTVLAELNEITSATEMTVELSVEGQLSIQFPGEPIVTI